MSLYLDTSILLPLHVEEPTSASLHKWLEGASGALLVADLAVVEFGSAVSRLVRMGHMTPAVAAETIGDFEHWRRIGAVRVDTLPADIRFAAELVREPHPPLLAGDAIHLATCKRLGAILVTRDRDLLKIGESLGIACFSP